MIIAKEKYKHFNILYIDESPERHHMRGYSDFEIDQIYFSNFLSQDPEMIRGDRMAF